MFVVRNVRARWLVLGLAAAVVVVLAALAWVGVRAILAKKELDAVTSRIGELQQAVGDQDLDTLTAIARDVAPHIAQAEALTSDPVWRATEVVPLLGANLTAARVASAQLDVLVGDLALPLAEQLPALSDGGGGIDVGALQNVAQTLRGADAALQASQHELDDLDLDGVLPAVADGVRQLEKVTDQVAPVVHDVAPFARIAPGLLGADGPRHILVIAQNNAELRTGGGISGSFVELTADKGKITLGGVISDAAFTPSEKPVAKVPKSTTKLYGDVVGRYVQNTTSPADFTVTAKLALAWWAKHSDHKPDLVLSIDTVVLASLLQATGPVDVKGVTLTSKNALHELLTVPYLTMSAEQQDIFFESVAKKVFHRAFGGDTGVVALAWALQRPLTEGRISAWSPAADEQRVLHGSVVGGPAARHEKAGVDAYAVYFSDGTGSKMDQFLKTSIATGTAECRDDGHRTVSIRVGLHSTAPHDAETLPVSMTGGGFFGTPAGNIRTLVSVAAPADSFFAGVYVDGKLTASPDIVDAGFPTSVATVFLSPGEKKDVEFRFISAEPGEVNPTVLHTPTMNVPKIYTAPAECD